MNRSRLSNRVAKVLNHKWGRAEGHDQLKVNFLFKCDANVFKKRKMRPWKVGDFAGTAAELKVPVVVDLCRYLVKLQFTVLNQLTFPVNHSMEINLYRRISHSVSRHLVRGILPGILDHHVYCLGSTSAYCQTFKWTF